jgi:hypothetical protein
LVVSCAKTPFKNVLLKGSWREVTGREEEDISIYWITLRKREDTGN